jgi:hypothetical protein
MSDENTPNGNGGGDTPAMPAPTGEQPGGNQQNVQVMFNEKDIHTSFSNGYFISQTAEEVLIHLGFNMPNPSAGQPNQPMMLFKVNDRVVLSYANAKRLAMSLTQLIKRHEQQFGEISVQQQQPAAR